MLFFCCKLRVIALSDSFRTIFVIYVFFLGQFLWGGQAETLVVWKKEKNPCLPHGTRHLYTIPQNTSQPITTIHNFHETHTIYWTRQWIEYTHKIQWNTKKILLFIQIYTSFTGIHQYCIPNSHIMKPNSLIISSSWGYISPYTPLVQVHGNCWWYNYHIHC